ncbi:MAG: hypothetical protein H6506_03785 [Calditrichaeota bacterium]|nr:hypothetical protein [Calditrichota bacterium]MCB9391754.1 hypothetical protein [Calditrichota bacterium]
MLTRALCALLLLWAAHAHALTITAAEYFFNSDPGPGNAVPIPITPGESVAISGLLVPVSALPANSSHGLFIRFQDDEGHWGNAERRAFFIHQPALSGYAGREISSAEYWLDNGAPTPFDLTDDPFVVHALLLPSSGLQTNSAHKLSVRFFSANGIAGDVESRWFFLHQPVPGVFNNRDITHVEYQFDNLTPTLVNIADNVVVNYAALLPVGSLTPNQNHKLTIRYLDEEGKWSNPEARYFFAIQLESGAIEYYDITHVEYSYDGVNPVLVDVSDGQNINYSALIASLGLQTNQSHKLAVRYLDERGIWSNSEARYVFVHESPSGEVTLQNLVAMEYWIDGASPVQVDIADAMNVSFANGVAHNAGPGPHRVYLRYVDETGERSNTESLPFFVWSGAGPSSSARLAGAEYFVNVDPGVGNGVQVTFPQDGLWDEQDENAVAILTGLPVGLHLFGIRFKDELGFWSQTLADTFVVGPVLVISVSGSDIILHWTANPDNTPFHVYRAPGVQGPYTEIGTSNSLSYTDFGVVNLLDRQTYYITTTNNGILSRFQLPAPTRKVE